jgi:Lrp/AsnC family transcriptional regulator, leucine-responsive regulatory protein
VDAIDRQIVDILRQNARTPVSEIARAVGLTAAPVARRIERMERDGTIRGYVAIVDEASAGDLEAFTEVRLAGAVDTAEIAEIARQVPEVQEFYTIAGVPDALLRFRVRSVDHLQQVVNAIRKTGIVSETRTLIVLASWDRRQESSQARPS